LKPGGYFLITAPFASITHFAPYYFSSGYTRFYYEHHLAANGLAIDDIQFNGNYFEFLAQETRRVKQVAHKYSNHRLNLFEKAVLHLQLYILQGLSRKDRGSNELLCFGVHVFGRKKS
jgi:hypothetical protein